VLFALLNRDHRTSYFRLWLRGWIALTGASIATLFLLSFNFQPIAIGALALRIVALFAFLTAILNFRAGENRRIVAIWPLTLASLVGLVVLERGSQVSLAPFDGKLRYSFGALNLASGWVLWRRAGKAHGARLLAALFLSAR